MLSVIAFYQNSFHRAMELGLLTSSVTLSLISQLIQISAIKLIMNMLAWLVQYTHTHTLAHTYTVTDYMCPGVY